MIDFPALVVDPTIFVAIISTVGLIITSAIGAVVVLRTNQKEKVSTAETSLDKAQDKIDEEKEKVFRERLALKQERIDYLTMELERAYAKLAKREEKP